MPRVAAGQASHAPSPIRAAATAAAAGCSRTRHIRSFSTCNKASRRSEHYDLRHTTHLGVIKSRRLLKTAAMPQDITATSMAFEPHFDSAVLTGQLLVMSVTLGAAVYWWYAVVPSARRTLAKDKRAGPLNTYLVNLQNNSNKKIERWFHADWLQQLERRQQLQQQAAARREFNADAQALRERDISKQQHLQQGQGTEATTAAATEQPTVKQQQQQQPEHEDDMQPSFWSLDNPVLATAAILGTLGLFAAGSRSSQLPL